MYRLYIDETGNADLNASDDPNHRYLSLTGVIIHQDHIRNVVTPQLNALKQDVFNRVGMSLAAHIFSQVDRKSILMTDEAGQYRSPGREFARHEMVNHSIGEYVRGEAHTNTVENYFSILKRGITGTYHHVSQQHLKRYLAEFDFRYNEREALGVDDATRMAKSIKGIVGKRMTYRRTSEAGNA